MTHRVPVAARPDLDLQLLYFTSTSLAADDRTLVVIGEADGQPNLYRVDLASGALSQLTDCRSGWLRSYVYFDGTPDQGFGKASVSFDAVRGCVYYLEGRAICRVDLDGRRQVLAHYPEGQVTGFTHVSADGRRLCVPTTDAAAFTEDADWPARGHGIDARVQRLGLSSHLRVYCTETGAELACEEVKRGWVTHVQFCPADPELILYNHEWPSDCGVRRIWLWDGAEHRRLRSEGSGRHRADWTCHEMWTRAGDAVIYHGTYRDGRAYIGRVAAQEGAEPVEVALPEGWTRYGHFTVGLRDGDLVTDGYYRADAGDGAPPSPWISALDVDWDARRIDWRVLGRSDSSWDSQDSHPHPIIDHGGRAVYFTSDGEGRRAVYRLDLDAQPLGRRIVTG